MAFPAILPFDKKTDKTYDQPSLATLEDDLLALCKFYSVNQDTVTKLCGEDFTTMAKVALVEDDEDHEELLACAVGRANRVALRHLLKQVRASDIQTDKTYDPPSLAAMEDDLLALCKFYSINQDTVTKLCGDDFTTTAKVALVEDDEDHEELLACAVGRANRVALRHLLKRMHAGDVQNDIPDPNAPPMASNPSAGT